MAQPSLFIIRVLFGSNEYTIPAGGQTFVMITVHNNGPSDFFDISKWSFELSPTPSSLHSVCLEKETWFLLLHYESTHLGFSWQRRRGCGERNKPHVEEDCESSCKAHGGLTGVHKALQPSFNAFSFCLWTIRISGVYFLWSDLHWWRVEIFVKTDFLVEKAFLFEISITVLRFELGKCFHLPVRYLFKLTKSFT